MTMLPKILNRRPSEYCLERGILPATRRRAAGGVCIVSTIKLSTMLVVLLLCYACTNTSKPIGRFLDAERKQSNATSSSSPDMASSKRSAGKQSPATLTHRNRQSEIQRGTGRFINAPKRRSITPTTQTEGGDITLNFQSVDLVEVIEIVLGTVLNVNYVIDPDVSGTVTIETARPLAKDEVLGVLESLISANGAALTIDEAGVYRVGTSESAARRATLAGRNNDGYRIEIIPLRYISVSEMQKLIEPFVKPQGILLADPTRNILMVAGTKEEIDHVIESVDVFDIAWFKGLSVGMYYLDYVEPRVLMTELVQALGGDGDKILGGLVKLQPITRLNAIMAVSPNAESPR